jgi:hypothetical protein
MKHDPRYAQWLEIADDLKALHEFVYGEGGPFVRFKDDPVRPTGTEASNWIRNKCAKGRWYWWDKTTLAGKAEEPLRSLQRVIGDSGGLYEDTEAGREMIAKIERLHVRIAAARK